MNTITTIVKREYREFWRRGLLRWLLLPVLALLVMATLVGFQRHHRYQAEMAAGTELSRQHWENQGEKNPHSAAHYGIYLFKPLNALSFFDFGVNPYTGSVFFLEAHYRSNAAFAAINDRSTLGRFGIFSPAFLLAFIAPLLIIFFGHASVSGERRRGTLDLVAATGSSPRHWLLGKWLATMSLIPPLVLTVLATAVIAAAIHGPIPSESWWRLAGLALLYAVYLGVFANLSLIASALTKHSGASLMLLVAFWIGSGLALPRLAASTSEQLHPTPNQVQFEKLMSEEKKAGLPGDGDKQARTEKLKEETLASYGVDKLEDLPINFNALAMQADEEYSDRVFDKHYRELFTIHANQDRIHRLFSLLSPTLAVRLSSMALAGTSPEDHRHFSGQAEIYRREFVALLNHNMMVHSKTGDWGYKADGELWHAMPTFKSQPMDPRFQAARFGNHGAILAFWFLISTALLLGWLPRRVFRRSTGSGPIREPHATDPKPAHGEVTTPC
ncbi:DUF3526 domain-containing protein [Sulfidibacter corallicola]|uniref:DUF3526 domain-containing protein n=1 Tax=Sulfidibacter corallicola TaxID=2818388 RepID=A0A8A4TJR3_SULCO|nr:DUF3526 domain-containing protein [Sulfidibacter corallicola]QTD49790.1 DUF3526 domain-containing protein [Sulfidibacter corallicola]